MAGRKVVDASDAQFCLAAAAAVVLSGRDWAHQNGVDAHSLHTCRMILGRKRAAVGAPRVRLVELVELEQAAAPPAGSPIQGYRGPFMGEVAANVDQLPLALGDQLADHRVRSLPGRVLLAIEEEQPWQGGPRSKGRAISVACDGGVGWESRDMRGKMGRQCPRFGVE